MVGMHALSTVLCAVWLQAGQVTPAPAFDLPGHAAAEAEATIWPSALAGTGSLTLVENAGQWPEHARFVGVLPGRVVRVERDGIAIELQAESGSAGRGLLRLKFQGASADVTLEGLNPSPGIHSFFLGNDPARWQRGLRGYAGVAWRDLYPGIDLILTDASGLLDCEVRVKRGADVGRMVVALEGSGTLRLAEDDLLIVESSVGEIVRVAGLVWQAEPTGKANAVATRLRSIREEPKGRHLPEDESSSLLTKASGLLWSTYLGGPDDEAINGLVLDSAGDIYVCGATGSGLAFPMTPGTFQSPLGTQMNCFAAKFRGSTGELVYSSVFGGSDLFYQIAVDIDVGSNGQVTVAGITQAPDFPTTPGAYDTVKDSFFASDSGFVLRFTPSGDDLQFSTFIEGSQTGATISALRVDEQDRCIIGGWAIGSDFPTTPGAIQSQYLGSGDGMVARLSADGSTLEWSTLLGGSSGDGVDRLVLHPSGDVIVAGRSGSSDFPTTPGVFMESKGPAYFPLFVARLNDSGTALVWSTFLGGTDWQETEGIWSLNLGDTGDVYVSGGTDTETFPTTPGAFQTSFQTGAMGATFVTRLTPDAKDLVFSTFYGGTLTGGVAPIVVDPSGVITGVGTAVSSKLWPTPGAFDTTFNGDWDYHLVRFSPQADRLFYAGFLGGLATDLSNKIAATPDGRLTFAGQAWFPGGFPTTPGAFQETFNGGQKDCLVTTLELYLLGVEPFGGSKPSCLGPLTMNVTEMPAPGATRFAFWCSAAPPNAPGWLIVQPMDDTPMPAFSSPWLRIPVNSDAAGYVETPFPLTGFAEGNRFSARYIFLNAPSCPPSGPLTWSNGLEVTITTPP